MKQEIYKKFSVFIKGTKIGTQTIRISAKQKNSVSFNFRSSILNQDIQLNSVIENNCVIKYEKTESNSGKIIYEKFQATKENNYSYTYQNESGIINYRHNLDFIEKVLYFPGEIAIKHSHKNNIIYLKTMDIYDIDFIQVEKNKLKIYSPEVLYVEYDESGILSYYKNLITGIEIIEQNI